jgi:3-oxoacyl-[acyl-carrier-protein] synthase-1
MIMSISAVGMVSALGLDWQTSCGAARAGVLRAAAVDFRIQAGDPWEVMCATAHEASLLTYGFEGEGRLLRLLAGAFRDLAENAPVQNGPTPVFLSVPAVDRTMMDDEITDDKTDEPIPLEDLETRARELVQSAARLACWKGEVSLAAVSTAGHAGVAAAFQYCASAFRDRPTQSAIVGAVDSLLDDETLAWLKESGRLKHPDAPTGLMPGEAAVLLLVTSGVTPQNCLATVEALGFSNEDSHFESGKPPRGRGLSDAIVGLAQQTDWPGTGTPWILSDHNGESYRANEWGLALHRLVARKSVFAKTRVSFPAVSFGETGAASASVAAACALAAWNRGYAPDSRCCVVSSSDAGSRAALLLSAAYRGNRL